MVSASSIIEDLGQNAVAVGADSLADLNVGALLDVDLGSGSLNAVDIHGHVLGGNGAAQVQILVDVASLDLLGVGQVSSLGVGADLLSLQLPHVSGTRELVGRQS